MINLRAKIIKFLASAVLNIENATHNVDKSSAVAEMGDCGHSRKRKGKERKSIYIAPFCTKVHTKRSWRITQFYLQITPCLPYFLRQRSPDGTTTTEAADIQLQLTTHLSTRKDEAEFAWLALDIG